MELFYAALRRRSEKGNGMKDSYGRTIDYMRISITDRCNLRCRYCMPDGIHCVPPEDILTMEEIQAVAMAAGKLGVRRVKVTGGEPLTRKGCCGLIRKLKGIPGIEKVTLTTNGILLDQYLDALKEAGIDGINISLDTVDRKQYEKITGQDRLDKVISGLEGAISLGVPVKLNAVSLDWQAEEREPGKPGWMALAELAGKYPIDVRFIEMMPIGYGRGFNSLDHRELLRLFKNAYPEIQKDNRPHGYGPAVYYRIPGFQGSIGFISAIHGKFCEGCNRIRLTSQGYLKACLCYEDGVDLRAVLREEQGGLPGKDGYDMAKNRLENGHWKWKYRNCPDDARLQQRLTEKIREAVIRKPAAHCFEQPDKITEAHNMVAIGG